MRVLVFDMDDVLWNLNDYVCSKIHLDINALIDYDLKKCNISDADYQKLIQLYSDVNTFKSLQLNDGAERIQDLQDYGYVIKINSNSFNQDIADYKLQVLHNLGFKSQNIYLNNVTIKDIDETIFGFIDDSAYNVANSKAQINFMPKKAWNLSKKMRDLVQDKNVKYYDDLNQLIQYLQKGDF